MVRRPDSASLLCECLESRDVPAIILDAAFNATRTDAAPLGGQVNISEVLLTTANPLRNRNNTSATAVSRPANSTDNVTLTLNGSTLTITNTDGIFGRVTGSTPATITYGTTLTIQNVTGVNLGMTLGGNDTVTDNTLLPAFIDAGPGNDAVAVRGADLTPLVALALQRPGGIDPNLLPFFGSGTKTVLGGDGNDTLLATGIMNQFTLDGGGGDDTIVGSAFGVLNNFRGGSGNDRVTGTNFGALNLLDGGEGNDVLTGGVGSDALTGGTGVDLLFGLGGSDIYVTTDVDFDLVANQRNDVVAADPFDTLTLR